MTFPTPSIRVGLLLAFASITVMVLISVATAFIAATMLIAKALAHAPRVLFLDEPTAGVDVELRKDMWDVVAELKSSGVTIILTTHYIEEAEAIADRVGVIAKGQILLVQDKAELMAQMGL
mgnify:CR=1 FL=1